MKSKADAASGYDWGVTGYTYDNGGQLTGAAYSDFANAPADESYGLDANGNRTSDDFTVVDPDGNNRMATGAGYRYSYDAEGNRTLRFVSEDDELGDGATDITRYIWDHRDRLTEVRHYATYTAYQSDAPDRVVEYAYDYQNRWVRKVVNPGTDAQEKTIFVYDGTQIAMQFDGTADATSTDPPLAASALSHRYLWGPKVDQILADEKLTGPTPEVLWTLGDHLNTVRDIVEYTGGVTTVTQHLVYNSFGTETSAIASSCLFGFTARPFDQDTGLQNNLNRWYEATTGRWVSEDPKGFAASGPNLYCYVGSRPITETDPGGMGEDSTAVSKDPAFSITLNVATTHCWDLLAYLAFDTPSGIWGQPTWRAKGAQSKIEAGGTAVGSSVVHVWGPNGCNSIRGSISSQSGAMRLNLEGPSGTYRVKWSYAMDVRVWGDTWQATASIDGQGKTDRAIPTHPKGESRKWDTVTAEVTIPQGQSSVEVATYSPSIAITGCGEAEASGTLSGISVNRVSTK